jgi:hypothetical protein
MQLGHKKLEIARSEENACRAIFVDSSDREQAGKAKLGKRKMFVSVRERG